MLPLLAALLAAALLQPAPAAATPPSAQPPAASAPAEEPRHDEHPEVVLYLRDGGVFTGILMARGDDKLVMEIAGVPAEFKAADIDRIRELPPVLERYKEMRDAVPADDVDRRIDLINWLADRRQLDIAVLEAQLLVLKNPKHIGAQRLQDKLQQDLDLSLKAGGNGGGGGGVKDDRFTGRIAVKDFPLLSAEQINLMKVYELDLTTNPPPNVIIPHDVTKRLLDEFASNPLVPASREGKDDLLRQPPVQILDLIFRLKARDYYDKVKVVDQPEPMRRFRDDVHRVYVLNSCATIECHGGSEAGRLVLATYRPNADPTVYTNFYILSKFRTTSGDSLIDWDQPEKSPLLQLGLPRDISRYRHPVVTRNGKDNWRPGLTGPDDTRFQAAVNWVKSMYRPRPTYTMDFTPYRPLTPPPPPAPPKKPGEMIER